jgi:hypothetical protein
MTAPRFTPPESYVPPPEDLLGFTAGVMRVTWTLPVQTFEIAGRPRLVYVAQIAEIHTRGESLKSADARAALTGLVVWSPEGKIARIAGVEMFAMMHVGTGASGNIGLLLVPMEES